jgi:hypothetical protein
MNPFLAPTGQSASGSAPAGSTSSSAILSSDQTAAKEKKRKAPADPDEQGEEEEDDSEPWTAPPRPPQDQVYVVCRMAVPRLPPGTMPMMQNFLRASLWPGPVPDYAFAQSAFSNRFIHTVEFVTTNQLLARDRLVALVDAWNAQHGNQWGLEVRSSDECLIFLTPEKVAGQMVGKCWIAGPFQLE